MACRIDDFMYRCMQKGTSEHKPSQPVAFLHTTVSNPSSGIDCMPQLDGELNFLTQAAQPIQVAMPAACYEKDRRFRALSSKLRVFLRKLLLMLFPVQQETHQG